MSQRNCRRFFAMFFLVFFQGILVTQYSYCSELNVYKYQLIAYNQGQVVDRQKIETMALNDQHAATLVQNKLTIWGQQLNQNGTRWNRLSSNLLEKSRFQAEFPDFGGPQKQQDQSILTIEVLLGHNDQTRKFSEGQLAGTRGQSLIMAGFSVAMNKDIHGVELEYMAHIQNRGDTGWVKAGTFLKGDTGSAITIFNQAFSLTDPERVEGVAFRLKGDNANAYSVMYRGHLEGTGDTDWYKDGEFCGTRGEHRRLEAFVIHISELLD
jgi:hypothetical protein